MKLKYDNKELSSVSKLHKNVSYIVKQISKNSYRQKDLLQYNKTKEFFAMARKYGHI